MKQVAIIGSTGQLGTDLVDVLVQAGNYEVIRLSHREVECTDPVSVEKALKTGRPDVVVNCAAFVRVDEAEDRAEEALRVNGLGALNVARACAEIDALCVYISMDYVFDGGKSAPYTKDDALLPINIYSISKLAEEYFCQHASPRFLVLPRANIFRVTAS